jgi:predicted PurR-regulated permease PerM
LNDTNGQHDARLRQVDRAKREAERERHLLSLTDPEPIADLHVVWRTAAQIATIGLFVLAAIVAIDLARPVLLPVASALVFSLMLGPLSTRAAKAGIPPVLTAIVLWLVVIAVMNGVLILLSAPVVDWASKAPQIAQNLRDKLHIIDRPLAALQDLRKALLPEGSNAGWNLDLGAVLQPTLVFITPAIGQMVIFFGSLFFFLLGHARLRHVLVFFFTDRDARLRTLKIMNDIERNLTNYLSVVALINAAVGLAAGIIAFLVGLPNAVAWGVLAFVLNFIPYIGALLMQLVFLAVGLVTFPTLTHALVAPLAYLAVATLEGHFVTPSIMGRRLTLNPLTVFLALVFWTWLWGPVGAFLAVPILIMSLVVISHLFPKDEPALPD